MPAQALGFRVQLYGMIRHRDLFTPRQLVALTTFSDLVGEAQAKVERDALTAGLAADGVGLEAAGSGASICGRGGDVPGVCCGQGSQLLVIPVRMAHRRREDDVYLRTSGAPNGMGLYRGQPVQRFKRQLDARRRIRSRIRGSGAVPRFGSSPPTRCSCIGR